MWAQLFGENSLYQIDSDGTVSTSGVFDHSRVKGLAFVQDPQSLSVELIASPGFTDVGTFDITVSVTDDGIPPLQDSEIFTLTVIDVNAPPTAHEDRSSQQRTNCAR